MAKYRALILMMTFIAGGCSGLPESASPLSPPGAEPYDPRILGSWFAGPPDDDKFYLHLKARSEPNMLDGTGILIDLEDGDFTATDAAKIAWSTAIVHPSRLEGRTYYNIARLVGIGDDYGAAEGKKGYIIVQADLLNDRTLKLCLMDNSIVEDAIKEGALNGALVEEDKSRNIDLGYAFIDVTAPELADFIKAGGADLFASCLAFHKLG